MACILSNRSVVLTTIYLLVIMLCFSQTFVSESLHTQPCITHASNKHALLGFTELKATQREACVGEDVTLSCATSNSYTRWEISLSGSSEQPVVRSFQRRDSVGRSYHVSTTKLQLHFELIFNAMGILNSTLTMHTTSALDRALIECEATITKHYIFQITRAPTQPMNLTLSQKTFGDRGVNFTLLWNLPTTGKVDQYHVNVSYRLTQTMEYFTTSPTVDITGIDYDQLVIISVTSINCLSESEKAFHSITFGRCDKNAPQNGLFVNDSLEHSHTIPGEEVMFTCNSGFSPQVIETAVCQENGTWTLDPTEMLCLLIDCQMPLVMHNHLEIVEESFNGTTLGLELHFKCEQGFVSEDLRPVVCSSEGVWIPDPTRYECFKRGTELDINFTQQAGCDGECRLGTHHTQITVIAGSVTAAVLCFVGPTLLILSMIICIIKRRRLSASTHLEADYGRAEEPIYDVIHPTYEVIGTERETKLTFEINDAYNLKDIHICR